MNTIFITTSFEGIHCWNDAPDEVSFLRFPHRHIFGVRVEIEIRHDDREIEFILFKNYINELVKRFEGDNRALSCEMMAQQMLDQIASKYPARCVSVEVNEDGENGAIVRK